MDFSIQASNQTCINSRSPIRHTQIEFIESVNLHGLVFVFVFLNIIMAMDLEENVCIRISTSRGHNFNTLLVTKIMKCNGFKSILFCLLILRISCFLGVVSEVQH